jgi:hypothetical protein
MNYSRRQLEAFGEPLGESVTRKEGGRIIYGGGGSSPPSTQTQVTDLPDWAKPYAQETLEKTKALTAGPYQAYGAPRIAGFSPLQEQAQAAAGQMGPSQLGQFGGRVAGAASLGALGTQYDPFRMGQFTAGRAAQYMNPFVEMAMEPQLREAQRSSEMQRMADQAQAVRSGAFGGGRQAIVEAERQRNLGMQQGDIRARGYMSAFDQAQQQFAREQQLREQSRQFGAGLGMQGFQTALQGAGQLGALGGQEFGQQKETIGLQSQMGAQQQALRQQGLTQAYQDFLNEQNYPYKQLGFMSDMIRGLPLGQQSTKQIYEPPGSMLGQIAGLGVGLGGMARFGQMFAEGGQVDEYADGGSVTSNYFVDNTLDKLSDVQLQQSKLAALNRGDREQVAMIDDEIAERASLRAGLGSAFNTLPEETQEAVTEMASGGIVAFAGPTEDNNYSLVQDPQFGGSAAGAMEMDRVRIENERARRAAQEDEARMRFLRQSAPETYERVMAQRPPASAPRAAQEAPRAAPPEAPRGQQARREEGRPARASGSISQSSAAAAVRTITEAANVQLPKDETQELAKKIREELNARSEPERKQFKEELDAAKNRSKEIEARSIGEAMMKFGFGMAKAAAKPGRRSGIAGAFESAAEAAPLISESMAETNKLKQAAQDNYMKLRMENARYETALDQGNMQLAASLANNISMRQLEQEKLKQQISQQDRMFDLKKKELDIMRARGAESQPALIKYAERYMREDPKLSFDQAMDKASRAAGYSFRSEGAQGGKLAAALAKIDEDYKLLPALLSSNPDSKLAQTMVADQKRRREEAYRLYGGEQPSGVGSASQVIRFDSKGNPIQ